MAEELTKEKAKQLMKVIVFFAGLLLLVLAIIIVVQTVKVHSAKNQLADIAQQTTQYEQQNNQLSDKIAYYEDPNHPGQVKEEIQKLYSILEKGLTNNNDIVYILK